MWPVAVTVALFGGEGGLHFTTEDQLTLLYPCCFELLQLASSLERQFIRQVKSYYWFSVSVSQLLFRLRPVNSLFLACSWKTPNSSRSRVAAASATRRGILVFIKGVVGQQ